jgi:hypothetical protein
MNMFRKILFLAVLFGVTHLMAFDKYNTAMGLHFGTSTGSGYSVRSWQENMGYQITLAAYTSNSNTPRAKKTASLGLNFLLPLLNTETYNFYLMAGASYVYRIKRKADSDSSWERDDKWTLGVGPGFEFALSDRFHLSIEVPMTVNSDEDIDMYIPSAGIYYYFN